MRKIPYGHQSVDESDIKAVEEVLRSDWISQGPKIREFEEAVARFVGARQAVAVSSGTAALHAAMYALGIGPGDEVIVPPITFAASANCVVYQGGTPVFCDVEPATLLIDPEKIGSKITSRTRAVVAVDYAGQPCDYDKLRAVTEKNRIPLVADACHSLGAKFRGRPAGSLADLSVFSFHPVKHITTGEGGMITTDSEELASQLKIFRNHGITTDHRQRDQQGAWFYEMVDLGFNYRITDFQCALGISQLKKLPAWLTRRREIASRYDNAFREIPEVRPLGVRTDVYHAYHLYVVRLELDRLKATRSEIFAALRAEGIGVNVHYIPVHLHPFYRNKFKTAPGQCPVAEAAFEQIISLPMFPAMKDDDIEYVITAVRRIMDNNKR